MLTVIKDLQALEICVDCDFEPPNKTRLNLHVAKEHKFHCEKCTQNVFGNKHFEEHNLMIHENADKTLTSEEFENLQATENYYDFMMSPMTPRRQDWVEKTDAIGYY